MERRRDLSFNQEPARLRALPPQDDLPPGPTVRCVECGARLRAGTVHTALKPWPHQALVGLAVVKRLTKAA